MSATYRYRASTSAGELVEGVLQGSSPRAVIDQLRQQTLVPYSVEAVASPTERAARRRWIPAGRRDDALATATRTMATMIAGGATLDRTLAFASEHATTDELQESLAGVRADVQRGESLAAALRTRQAQFGALAPSLVRAGEESGRLDEALERLADHVERVRTLRSELHAALLYPALMGIVSAVGVVILLAFVVPRFVVMLRDSGGTLPPSTRALMLLSGGVTHWWWLGTLLIVGAVAVGRAWVRDEGNRRRWHAARLRWPVVGALEHSVQVAHFARAFGTLLRGGSGVLTALRTARESVSNAAIGAGLDDGLRAIERGERVAPSLAPVLPPLAAQLLAVGEESGTLDGMALRVADTYDAESQRTLRSLVALVEPALIVGFGLLVGFVALAMLQAIYSINASAL